VAQTLIDSSALIEPLRTFLPRQRWYAGAEAPSDLSIVAEETLRDASPAFVELLVEANGARYQVPVGLRPSDQRPAFLRGRDDAVLGEVRGWDGASWLAYDALLDTDLDMLLLDVVSSSHESAERVRPVSGEQSNSSVVYDERLILKLFRKVHPGRNLDVEMTEALAAAGFDHVAHPLATFSRRYNDEEYDLAVLQPFLAGGVDGWALALTSLRDLFGVSDTQPVPIITEDMQAPPPPIDPAEAGGDFSAEASRLGAITAAMHAGMAAAFGREPGDARAWADHIEQQARELDDPRFERDKALRLVQALRRVGDAGPAIRLHGDYHLGQVLRTDAGWFVLDFEGEPDRSPRERRRPSSPLRDVAGMLRSLGYASAVALFERDEDCRELASAWELRNRKAFLDGYVRTAARAGLLPDPAATEIVLSAFELEKAMYELSYERGHRPDWESIPLAALRRLAAS
jgi:maltokinase